MQPVGPFIVRIGIMMIAALTIGAHAAAASCRVVVGTDVTAEQIEQIYRDASKGCDAEGESGVHDKGLPPELAKGLRPERPAVSLEFERVQFEHNSAELLPDSMPLLSHISAFLSLPSMQEKKVSVSGHTDAQGDAEYNLRLSRRRARAVAAALVASGIDARRIEAVGYGKSRPLPDVSPFDGSNRRVEFAIFDE